MQLFWKQIVATPLLNALQRLAKPGPSSQPSLPDLSFALVSLGKVGLTSGWIQKHHPTLLQGIIRGMAQLIRVGSGGETAAGLEALASLDISYSSLPKDVQICIQEAIKLICPLPPAPLTSCPSAVLCSLMHSTSLLIYDTPPEELDEEIISTIARLVTRAKDLLSRGVDLTMAERDRMCQLFTCLRVFFPANSYPALPRLPPLSSSRKDGGMMPPSKLQTLAVRALLASLQGYQKVDQKERKSGDEEDFEDSSNGSEDVDADDLALLRWGQGLNLSQEFIGLQDEVFPVDIRCLGMESSSP